MILLPYDGSTDARTAIDRVAGLMPGARVTVLTVWESMLDAMSYPGAFGLGLGPTAGIGDPGLDEQIRDRGASTAQEGARLAIAAGLVASPRACARHGSVAHTVCAVAEELDADLIVLGTRGLSGLQSLLTGSTAHGVVQHATCPVMVVPSWDTVAARAASARDRVTTTPG